MPLPRGGSLIIQPTAAFTAIYVNGMDSEPLAACPAFATQGRKAELQAGVDLLRRLCKGPIRVALRSAGDHQSDLRDLNHVEVHDFRGPHPSGLVGTHIHAIAPLKAGQVVWCLKAQDLVRLGSWAQTGRYPAHVVIALSGFGVAMVYSAGVMDVPFTLVAGLWRLQLLWFVLALLAIPFVLRIPVSWYERIAPPLYALAVVLLALTLVIGTGVGTAEGVPRWIVIGPVRIHTAEFAKIPVIMMLARVLGQWREPPTTRRWQRRWCASCAPAR